MAIINKTGITTGGTIQAEHVTRAIDALSGGSTDTVVATGSFSGSFKGDGSGLIGVGAGFPYTGSAIISGSLIVTGSTNISSVLTVNGSSIFNDALNANSIITANAGADFNDAVNVNVNPLMVNTQTYISAKTNIVTLDNSASISESVVEYPAGTTFFVDMTQGSATASFQFEPLNSIAIGTSYKILITKWSTGQIILNNIANAAILYGHYVSDEKPDSFADARSVKIITPETTCIQAYFIDGGGNDEWFFDISTAGTLSTT
jgi:hypothetical protein